MKTIKIGYARVSTNEIKQELGLELQVRALKKRKCDYIFSETVSGTKDERIEFNKALELAEKIVSQNTKVKFIVYKLDRLARHLIRTLMVIDKLTQLGIKVVSLKEDIDTDTPSGILQYQMLAMFAEYEVNQTKQRTRDALAELKKKGKVLGRPRVTKSIEMGIVQHYKMPDYPIEKIATKYHICPATVYNIAKRNNLTRRPKSSTLK